MCLNVTLPPQQASVTPMFTPTMTPGSSYQTPLPGIGTTPSYSQTPQQNMGAAGGAPTLSWPGATPRTPAARTPQQPRPMVSGDMDWAKAAEMWANRSKKTKSPRASPRPSPNPARKGMESPFGGSNQGDGTPLIDER